MIQVTAEDDRFDGPGWAVVPAPPFRQRYQQIGNRMYCETVCTISGTRQAAIEVFRGPWTWWTSGRVIDYRTHADGCSDQGLAPIWWYLARIGLHIMPATPLERPGSAMRVPVIMSRHIVGLQTIDVIDAGENTLTVRGRLHGATAHFPGAPTWLMIAIHLRVESGTALWPFPRRTGWWGLDAAVASRVAAMNAPFIVRAQP